MRHALRSLILGVVAALVATYGARAEVIIGRDRGGRLADYQVRFAQIRDAGERVIINGECFSACTLVLDYIPRSRLCATPHAKLGFHEVWNRREQARSESGTRFFMESYPPALRRWIGRRGGLTSELLIMQPPELYRHIPRCT